jgi:hypothetical protein
VSNITDQHLSPNRRKKYPPNPKTLGISAFSPGGMQKLGVAFKGHGLK